VRAVIAIPVLLAIAVLPADGGGLSPEDAVRRMRVPDGFEVRLVACEPEIRQPISMSFDDRGRLWVIQYLQYPNPAGLKPVQVDQFLRTKYDRVPEPPPRGPKGADRITILSEPDASGHYRKAKDFVTGLNLCSGMCLGHGGVFVMQPPYLLFYADRNGDDVPDGDPEVLLSGFGTEDAHAYANSLQWGPDGWLYGTQGSTVTANVRGIEFQQGIWRYHPRTKQFELFSEGGGNTWGLDFNARGQAIAGTNFGGVAMLHQVQGGYYVKNFGKHGALHNPHAYGYFDHVPCPNFHGGHVTIGGIVYGGGLFPNQWRGRYLAGNILDNRLLWYELTTKGSSYSSRQGGEFLVANDPWFRPVDCLVGPDGAVYVADWYDQRANHVDPVDNWDKSNGRVYRVAPKDAPSIPAFALSKLPSRELVGLLSHANNWYVGEARRLLAERRDPAVLPELTRLVRTERGQLALEALWALYVSSGLTDAVAAEFLIHPNDDVRTWTVRLLGDTRRVKRSLRDRLISLARSDPSATVHSQLACTAKRLPAADGLPIVREMLNRSEDVGDPHIPLLLWWVIEDKAILDREAVLSLLDESTQWRLPLVRHVLLERIGRRYLAEATDEGYRTCARLLDAAPGNAERALLVRGMEQALVGRRLPAEPEALSGPLANLKADLPPLDWLRFAVRLGNETANRNLLMSVADAQLKESDRVALIRLLSEVNNSEESAKVLLAVLAGARSDGIRLAAISALASLPAKTIPEVLVVSYAQSSPAVRRRIVDVLVARSSSARQLLQAVVDHAVPPQDISVEQLRRIAAFKDADLDKLIAKHWGKIAPPTSGEKIAHIRHIASRVLITKGDPKRGKELFTKQCATCHTLFGEGGKTGPDLTGADRKNRDWLVTNIVDPSGIIRPEYVAYDASLKDGRSLFGLIVEQSPQTVTLLDAKNEKTVIERTKIESLEPSATSIMPEKLLDELTEDQLRDLFAYLQSDAPPQK
jgi:putative membrane-bound dehydrogenase-like protein